MPYSSDPNLDEDNDKNQSAGADQVAGGAGSLIGGASAPVSGATQAPGSPTHSGNFQNLNSYLDANSGSGFGDKFVGKVSNDVNAAGSAQKAGADQFKGASDAGTVNENESVVNSAFSDPYGFSKDQNNVKAFNNQLNASYKGPVAYSDDAAAYQTAYGATQKAQDTANAAQSEGGRFALLNNYFGTPDYNQGQKSLDNLLIQADPTTSQGLQQAKQNADKAQVDFQNQGADLQKYAAQNVATTQNTAADVASRGNALATGLQGDYGKALTDATAARANALHAIQSGLASGDTSQFQNLLGGMGLVQGPNDSYVAPNATPIPAGQVKVSRPGSGNYIQPAGAAAPPAPSTGYWGVNPLNYLNQNALPTQSSVLDINQQQKLDALQGLLGQTETPFNAAEAGTYDPKHPVSVNTQAFQDAMNTAANNYGQYQSGIMGNVSNLAGTSMRGSLTGQTTGPDAGTLAQIQAQYDQLNAVRKNYGLSQVTNPYAASAPTAPVGSGPVVRGGL